MSTQSAAALDGAATSCPVKLLVLCPYPFGVAAVQRFKFERFYDDWRANGFDVEVSPFMGRALWDVLYTPGYYPRKAWEVLKGYGRRLRDLARIPFYDVVFVHAWVTPLGSTLFERVARLFSKKLIYDLEDNLLAESSTAVSDHPNPILRFIKGKGKVPYLVRTADLVITSTPFLTQTAAERNAGGNARYIGPSVEADRFVPPDRSGRRAVTIGWTGTFSSRPYLDLLRPVLQELGRRVEFKLLIIGNFDYELPGVDLEVVRWSAETEVEDLQRIDIGIYPLATDDWVLGKGGLKAIQYMTVGAPPVATNVGTNPMIIRHGENGFLVGTDAEWLAALEALVRDPDLRRRVGEEARKDAVRTYSVQAIAGDYRQVLTSVAKGE